MKRITTRAIRGFLSSMVAAVLIISTIIPVSAASIERDYSAPFLLTLSNHGHTTIRVNCTLTENYSIVGAGDEATYSSRQSYVTITSSRPDWDTPYTPSVSPIKHKGTNGAVVQTFSMQNQPSYFPPAWFMHYKTNSTSVRKLRNNSLTSSVFIQVFAPGCTLPYGANIDLALAV